LPPLAIDENAVAQRLAQAVRLKTVSSASDAQLNADQFEALHALLEAVRWCTPGSSAKSWAA
jgi:carboxypeptidase PM20D1